MSESAIRSREEDEELQQSTKKVKESHWLRQSHENPPYLNQGGSGSYKEKLIGEILGAFEKAFAFEANMEIEVESDDEFFELPSSELAVKLSETTKARIRSQWANVLIVKVFGKMVGYNYLRSHVMGLWKPTGRMDCIGLGQEFFLIKFSMQEDHTKVLREGPWFVGGHYLSIRSWEPNFRPSLANLSLVAIWICLPKLPIEYYDHSVLREIGEAIGPILRIDTHTVVESRGCFAKLCVQVSLDKPIVRLFKFGGIDQQIQYEGIGSLCFDCGRVGHKVETYRYMIRTSLAEDRNGEESKS